MSFPPGAQLRSLVGKRAITIFYCFYFPALHWSSQPTSGRGLERRRVPAEKAFLSLRFGTFTSGFDPHKQGGSSCEQQGRRLGGQWVQQTAGICVVSLQLANAALDKRCGCVYWCKWMCSDTTDLQESPKQKGISAAMSCCKLQKTSWAQDVICSLGRLSCLKNLSSCPKNL